MQVGRVCLVNYGPDEGKLCTVVDIIDGNKVMVDGPLEITGVSRQMMPLKRLALTDLAVSIPKSSKDQVIKDAFEVSEEHLDFLSSVRSGLIEV